MCHNVFNVRPKTALLLLVWPGDAERLDTHARTQFQLYNWIKLIRTAMLTTQMNLLI